MAEAAGPVDGHGHTMYRLGVGHIFIGVELAHDTLVEAVLGLEACEAGDGRVRRKAGDRGARLDRGPGPDLPWREPVVCLNNGLGKGFPGDARAGYGAGHGCCVVLLRSSCSRPPLAHEEGCHGHGSECQEEYKHAASVSGRAGACGVRRRIADDPNLKFEGVRGRTGRASNFSLYSSLKYFNNLLHASKAMITDNGLMGGVIAVLRYL